MRRWSSEYFPRKSLSGARHASNRSSALVLSSNPRARRDRSIVRSRCSSGKSCARRSTSAQHSSSRFAAAQTSTISSSASLLSFMARRTSPSRRHRSVLSLSAPTCNLRLALSLFDEPCDLHTVAFSSSRTMAGMRPERYRPGVSRQRWDHTRPAGMASTPADGGAPTGKRASWSSYDRAHRSQRLGT